ncbi:MAG: DDE-type integrase/transposase/recombinase [Rhodococcus sp.]|nr:DDE-type integrase/transposase/recombinase [Rhodococcus sp. (in: high G+C Gram-positive bacteria)]
MGKRQRDCVERGGPVGIMTYIRTHSGWAYAAFVLDVFSRMVVGWQVSTSMRTELALDALDMGLWARRRMGQNVAGLIDHSDRGVQGGFNWSKQHVAVELIVGVPPRLQRGFAIGVVSVVAC